MYESFQEIGREGHGRNAALQADAEASRERQDGDAAWVGGVDGYLG